MKTVGELLREARVRKNISRAILERRTKIKKEFIEALEKEEWDKLPEFPVVQGFVKNVASALKISQKQASALLRRDYPPKSLNINPKPDVSQKFSWSPRLTFIVGIGIVTLAIFAYLVFQFFAFVTPPKVEVILPQEGAVVTEKFVVVEGKTDLDSVIKINNQPVLVSEDGSFRSELEIFEGTTQIEIIAVSRSGKETLIYRNIKPELE